MGEPTVIANYSRRKQKNQRSRQVKNWMKSDKGERVICPFVIFHRENCQFEIRETVVISYFKHSLLFHYWSNLFETFAILFSDVSAFIQIMNVLQGGCPFRNWIISEIRLSKIRLLWSDTHHVIISPKFAK